MNPEEFEKDTAAFSLSQIQDFIALLKTLRIYGYTTKDVEEYIELKRTEVDETIIRFAVQSVVCSDCGKFMSLLPVNDSPKTQTGNSTDKSVWFCRSCGESIYNKESVKDILMKLKKKGGT